jgi:putative ABC transport system permease protein
MDALRQDVRFALRSFARRPAFAVSAVLSLAIGIAASSAVFSIINAALFKPIPGVTKPERLVEISRDVNGDWTDVSWTVFDRLRAERSTLEDLGAFALVSSSIAGEGEPVARAGLAVTGNYFELLGVRPALGRTFAPDEASWPAVAPVALITHDAWQREFNAAADVVGRAVRINGVPVEIIGVLPERFAGHHTALLIDVFLPLGLRLPGLPNPDNFRVENSSSVELLGRLAPGVSVGVATQRLSEVADRLQRESAGARRLPPYAVSVSEWGPLPGAIRSSVAAFLTLLLVLVGLALAMACANVATVLLARAVDRQRELAVRRAIGASRQRLVRQLVTEVSVLFVAAGVTGVLFASWATGLLAGVAPPIPIPGRLGIDLGFDGRVLGFSMLVTLGTALVFNLLPALSATRFDVVRSLREGASSDTRTRARLRSVLVGAQVAVTCTLLFATVLFGRALETMRGLRPQWNVDGVLVTAIDLELNGTTREAGMAWHADVRTRIAALPGVESVAWATKLPIGGRASLGFMQPVGVASGTLPAVDGSMNRVSPGYFRSMGINLRRGRDFSDDDRDGAPRVAILNETMARGLFGDADPIGRRFQTVREEYRLEFEVVGIAGDSRIVAPGRPADNALYLPIAQMYSSDAFLHVRATPGLEKAISASARAAIRETSSSVPLPAFRPLTDALELYLLPQRLAAWVAAVMGIFGLVLAGVGIYGVAAFAASRRAREVAIRMALGATDRDMTKLLLRSGARAPAVGLLLGLGVGTGLSAVAASFIPGVRVADPVALLGVAVAISVLAASSLTVPVRALLRGSPMRRLRED